MNTDKSATISLADEDAVKDVLVNAVFGLWDIVNNLTRLRPYKRERYRADDLRLGAGGAGNVRLQRSSARQRRHARRDGLRQIITGSGGRA